jgi:hypothetical protein
LAELNLLCARGLCATNEPDPQTCASTLEAWPARIRSETERHLYRFERNPQEYENSAGLFRMLMLCVVLDEDYVVHYDAQRRAGPDASRANDRFFADASSVFLHGLLGPERKGTCSSRRNDEGDLLTVASTWQQISASGTVPKLTVSPGSLTVF